MLKLRQRNGSPIFDCPFFNALPIERQRSVAKSRGRQVERYYNLLNGQSNPPAERAESRQTVQSVSTTGASMAEHNFDREVKLSINVREDRVRWLMGGGTGHLTGKVHQEKPENAERARVPKKAWTSYRESTDIFDPEAWTDVLAKTDRTHFSKRSWQTQYNEMAAEKQNRDRDWTSFMAWARKKKEEKQ
jgi:hypothetical protein